MRHRKAITQIEDDAALYALGALAGDEAERFRRRLDAGCPVCQGALAECREVVDLLPLAAPEVQPPPSIRGRLMDRIAGAERPAGAPAAMGEGVLVRAGDTEWKDAPAPGVQYRSLRGSKTMLVRMAPGTWLPMHDHKHAEQCLVLEGSIASEGVTAYAGDYTYMPAGSVHSALYSETGALFLIAYS
jgi:mannose-6-phosphate isomerase-like protein (cupin superfamily)